ncbi:Ribosomal large subunit pseudouridine synthase B [Liberibacter crescens BT-1]|uniref:Pseudouridine synthase n=1 Tax=Liberibacter crescens (strain BT-1) TaxID=1215343 RepID=L0ETQ4_LIBCB|nr:Ribosomal large subunit pseudouridine synthase B [Liberibacter crescens BT-1]
MEPEQIILQSGRISKFIARAGIASRREVENMIKQGRVKVNGMLLDTPVINVTSEDQIEIDGKALRKKDKTRLWLYYKPSGCVTTNFDPEGRPTVFERLPDNLPRVITIGRLDINTEGLLLLTNDGGLSRILELPSTGWLRRYRVRAYGHIDQSKLDKLATGLTIDGIVYKSIQATLDSVKGSNVWITMGLREGKNREIKKIFEVLGLKVNRLIRISYGPFQLGEMSEGDIIEVRSRVLRDQLGPNLVEQAGVSFDAPVYCSEVAVQNNVRKAPINNYNTVHYKNDRKRDRITDKPREEIRSSLWAKRTSRSSNIWRAPDIYSSRFTKVGTDLRKKSFKDTKQEKPYTDLSFVKGSKNIKFLNKEHRKRDYIHESEDKAHKYHKKHQGNHRSQFSGRVKYNKIIGEENHQGRRFSGEGNKEFSPKRIDYKESMNPKGRNKKDENRWR